MDIFHFSEPVVYGLTIILLDDATATAAYSGSNVQWRPSEEFNRPNVVLP